MNALSGIFAAIVAARNTLYERGAFATERLKGPVVSVGNISVGGAGKTPSVIALGRELATRGIPYDILSRGYRRRRKGTLRLPDSADPTLYGDEPALLQQELQVPVFVANIRARAGQMAEAELGSQLHLLDDAFQHRRLHRDFDIVLLSPDDLHDRLLPAGRLREPLASLRRADAIVVPEAFQESIPGFEGAVWRVRRRLIFDGEINGAAYAFCGIAQPPRFFELLTTQKVDVRGLHAFRDHHHYAESDCNMLLREAQRTGVEVLVTTSKDAIKLAQMQLPPEFTNRLRVARLVTEIVEPEAALDHLLETLRQRCPGWFPR